MECSDLQAVQLTNDEGLKDTLKGQHSNSDLVSGIYEGGLKVWECSLDLVRFIKELPALVEGKVVLEIGCGQGLPGVMALKCGASSVIF